MNLSSIALRLCAIQTHIHACTRHDYAVSEMNSRIIGAQTSPKLVAGRAEKGQNQVVKAFPLKRFTKEGSGDGFK